MKWTTIFKPADVVTPGDRAELERLEISTKDLRDLAARIEREWPGRSDRADNVRGLAARLADNPRDPDLYERLELAATMPLEIDNHRAIALSEISRKIEAAMHPQHAIVRRCLRRALEQAEAELKRTEGKERQLAAEEGYDFSPSGRVLALQRRLLELRNALAAKIPGEEGCIQSPEPWRERLREWL